MVIYFSIKNLVLRAHVKGTEAFMPFRVQRHKGTEAQGHRGTEAQRHRGTEAQRHRGTEAFMPFRVQGHKVFKADLIIFHKNTKTSIFPYLHRSIDSVPCRV